MKKQIFPSEVVESTAEYHFYQHRSSTKTIYQVILGVLFLAFLALFIIKVDISVKSAGIFKPETERNDVKALIAGRVEAVFIKENMPVKAGQTLLTIHNDVIEDQNNLASMQQADYQNQVNDLTQLVMAYKKNDWSKKPNLVSGIYSQQFSLFLQKVNDVKAKYEAAQKNYNRYAYLYKNRAVSAAEFDLVKLQLANAKNQLLLVGEDQGSRWQTDLSNLQMTVEQLASKNKQLEEEKKFYTLKSPVNGTIQNFKGVKSGSLLSINEIVAEISPDDGLVAETYVLPKDIGLLSVGTKARFQIDAFNYNEWGMLTGKVVSISNDVFSDGGQPYFKVKCKMDTDVLKLKNGYKGHLKKGMTLQARFFVTRRRLSQLLYDKMDDWLNPNVIPENAKENELQAVNSGN